MSFDAWGKRRAADWTALASGTEYLWQNQALTRGYTFHEQLDPVGLVHMNGRVYDPEIGRFLSADIVIQDITNSQALNAYTYVLNNPLSLADPSGYFFLTRWLSKIGNFFRGIFNAIGRAIKSSIGRAIIQIMACNPYTAAFTCAEVSAGLTLAAGGSIKAALISAALAFAQAPVKTGGLDIWGSVGTAVQESGTKFLGTLVSHAAVSGAISMAQGGSFASGAIAGAVGAVGNEFAGFVGARDVILPSWMQAHRTFPKRPCKFWIRPVVCYTNCPASTPVSQNWQLEERRNLGSS